MDVRVTAASRLACQNANTEPLKTGRRERLKKGSSLKNILLMNR